MPIVLEEALMELVPTPVDVPEVGQAGGGTTMAFFIDMAMAWTSEPELPTSSAIGGSAPKGVPMMEEVPLAPIGPKPTVATADPSVGARPSWSLVWLGYDPLAWGRKRLHCSRRLDPSNLVFTLDDPAKVKDWTSMCLGL